MRASNTASSATYGALPQLESQASETLFALPLAPRRKIASARDYDCDAMRCDAMEAHVESRCVLNQLDADRIPSIELVIPSSPLSDCKCSLKIAGSEVQTRC